MKLIGLTGGVGMGKSAVADLLQRRGLPIVDSDLLARQLVEPGQPSTQAIAQQFGSQFVDSEGRVRRGLLAERVFSDPTARKQLEELLHPQIRQQWRLQANGWRERGLPLGVIVIPLLFETAAENEFDVTLCVACSPGTQKERLRQRRWTDAQIEQRVAAQWPVARKLERSTFVVWTEGEMAATEEQVNRILEYVAA